MSRFPTSFAAFLLGFLVLSVQPAAIPLGWAVARRVRRRGGQHPVAAGIAGWAAGCVLCGLAFALVSAVIPSSAPDWLVFLLAYLPLWLLTALLLRGTRAR